MNCAGFAIAQVLDEMDMDVFERIVRVNTLGTAFVTRALLPGMKAAGGGRILITSSIVGQVRTRACMHACMHHVLGGVGLGWLGLGWIQGLVLCVVRVLVFEPFDSNQNYAPGRIYFGVHQPATSSVASAQHIQSGPCCVHDVRPLALLSRTQQLYHPSPTRATYG